MPERPEGRGVEQQSGHEASDRAEDRAAEERNREQCDQHDARGAEHPVLREDGQLKKGGDEQNERGLHAVHQPDFFGTRTTTDWIEEKSTSGFSWMFWNRLASVDDWLETVPIGMPRGNFDLQRACAERAGRDDRVADAHVRALRHTVENEDVARAAAAAHRADHLRVRHVGRRHRTLAVGEQRDARLAARHAIDRAHERAAPVRSADRLDDDAAQFHTVRLAGADDDALVERALRSSRRQTCAPYRSRRSTAAPCS